MVNYWEKLPKSKSYCNLKLAKQQYFSYIASKVEPYLRTYQADNPMIPYMYFDRKTILKDLLEIIVELEAIRKCKTGKRLIETDFEKKKLIKVDIIDLGFGVDASLKKLHTADLVSKAKVPEFKKECQQLVITMVSILIEKSPLGSDLFMFSILSF